MKLIHQYLFVILILLIIALFKVAIVGVIGDNGFEPDSYLHFLQAKTVFSGEAGNIKLGLDVWAKPFYTYSFGAWLLLFNSPVLLHAKLFNILIFGLVSFTVFLVLRKLNLPYSYALFGSVISNIGFLSLRSSISELTEPIFTLLFMLSIYFWVRGNKLLSAGLIGLSVTGRIEALLFVGIWGLYRLGEIYMNRKIKIQDIIYFVLLILPTFIWNFLGYLETDRLFYLFDNGYPTARGLYGYGHPFFYIEGLFYQEGMLMTLILIGIFFLLNQTKFKQLKNIGETLKNNWMFLIVLVVAFTSVQSILYMFGLFGTAGLLRYFIPIMPVFSILGAASIHEINKKIKLNNLLELGMIFSFIFIYGLVGVSVIRNGGFYKGLYNRPIVSTEFKQIWEDPFIDIINNHEGTRLVTNRPELIYYSGRDLNNATFTESFEEIPPKSLVMIEKQWLARTEYDINYFENRSDLKPIQTVYTYTDIFVYYKT